LLARPEGLEPPAYWFEASRSIRLSYGRVASSYHAHEDGTGADLDAVPRASESYRKYKNPLDKTTLEPPNLLFLPWDGDILYLQTAMIESVLTILITASSVLLFGYWFRYTCLLILSAKTTRDYAADVATANQLGFLEIQAQLRTAGETDLERLHVSLDRDYALITHLIQQASQGESRIEDRMLQVNYKLMGAWYRVSHRFSAEMARRALDEMSMVVAHFANSMGERAACASAA
jgi:hypothetical protein